MTLNTIVPLWNINENVTKIPDCLAKYLKFGVGAN